jgi:transcriptional regulator of heat shock response
MMMPTIRQKEILNVIVEEYINSAVPISSKLIDRKYNFDISPATLRIEMQKLTNEGLLCQPHTSAGRIPTDQGYRLFVNNLLENSPFSFNSKKQKNIAKEIKKELESSLRFAQIVTKILADNSSNFSLSYIFNENLIWKEGWEDMFNNPESKDIEFISRFAKTVGLFEKNISDFVLDYPSGVKVYIGKETPKIKSDDTSIITTSFKCSELGCSGMFVIMGPKRMDYEKNISIINLLTKLLEE